MRWTVFVATLALLAGVVLAEDPLASPGVEDAFGRSLEQHPLVLVDREGPLGNPAIGFVVVPPPGAEYPAKVWVSTKEKRIYFDRPCELTEKGPFRYVALASEARVSVRASIVGDDDGQDEDHALTVAFEDARGRRSWRELAVRVVDQDRDRQLDYPIKLDFSHDETGFFDSEAKRDVLKRAVRDWAYFLDGDRLDQVGEGAELTWIWNKEEWKEGAWIPNTERYTGYLLYVYGHHTHELRSGGEPSIQGGFQSRRGRALPVRRSGSVEVETSGNYNELGWFLSTDPADAWRCSNLRRDVNDLFSVAHHEVGHALFFNYANTRFGEAKKAGALHDPELEAYVGKAPAIDATEHFTGTKDPESGLGAFGNEYHGDTPYLRWQITKTDLMAARALGYTLRKTSAFEPLALATTELPAAKVGARYTAKVRAAGGLPAYDWSVSEGSLPAGLELDRFTGEISGTPASSGATRFEVRVRDSDPRAKPLAVKLGITVN